jgi:hypothetical protein
MDEKQLAERLRDIANNAADADVELRLLADELDPPKPEPGTVVLWRMDGGEWQTGIVSVHMQIFDADLDAYEFYEVQWKPARILGPRQVAVDVPPIKYWDPMVESFGVYTEYEDISDPSYYAHVISREEAERMEASDEQ